VHEKVRAGSALSDAFATHGDQFPRVYTASLLAGERSGNLDAVLRRYVEYTKIIATVKRKTVSALVYPAILISLALVLVAIIVLKVVPAFADFYGSFGADLPLITKVILRVSDLVRTQFILIIAGIVGAVVVALTWVRQPGQKARFDHLILGVPGNRSGGAQIRDVANVADAGDAARRRPSAGERPRHLREVDRQSVHGQQLEVVGSRVREGASFASALEARGVFPDVAVKMAEVGESTGALQDMLNTVADFYDEEISTRWNGS
jgi:type IV pilus assembly protein PilC